MRLSLTSRLALFWVFTAVVAAALGVLLNGVYDQGAGSQISQGNKTTQAACRELQRKFTWAVQNKSFESSQQIQFEGALLEIILDHYTGVEGGFWDEQKGFTAYAYPTYEGTSAKRDVPEAEKTSLAKVAKESLDKNDLQTELVQGQREAMLLTACPIQSSVGKSSAWTMTRVPLGTGVAYDHFIWGLALLLGFVLVTGAASSVLLYGWSKNLKDLEAAIKNHPVDSLPSLALTKEAELDSIVVAINELNLRFRSAREDSHRLARQLAQSDRLAALGKMAAGIAHEIRNPLATLKLKFENALVAPGERFEKAAPVIMEQVSRMDRLIQMLLAMTQPFELKAQEVDVERWLNESFPAIQQKAIDQHVKLRISSTVSKWSFDPFHLGRALENLLLNALAFTPPYGGVSLTASQNGGNLRFEVKDSGPGVSGEIRQRLFEPFVTGRPNGTGLGLLLVKEIAEAHGGTISEVGSPTGACFRLEIPWLKS